MTAPLRELLDDLASDLAPLGDAPPVDARGAWASGRRRRRARRVQGVSVGLAVVLLAVLLVPLGAVRSPAQWAGPSAEAVDDFPARLGRQWWVRPLPDRPGPLALLVQGGPAFPQPWYGVAPDGTRWRLPEVSHRTDQYPTLSPDGRLLGYLETEDGPYVLRDLVDGTRLVVDGVTDNRGDAGGQHQLGTQTPTHWAPDASRAVLPSLSPVLLDVRTGRLTPVATPAGGQLAGFAGDDVLVWLRTVGPDGSVVATTDPAGLTLEAVLTDLAGGLQARVALSAAPQLVSGLSQWAGAVSPDGSQVAVLSGASFGGAPGNGQVDRFDLRTGRQVASTAPAADLPACGPAWGERLVVPGHTPPDGGRSGALSVAVDGELPETLVVVEDHEELRCAVWASGALVAGGGQALLGTSTAWISWWWPELAAAALLVVLLVVLRGRTADRRPIGPRSSRRRRTSTPSADWYA